MSRSVHIDTRWELPPPVSSNQRRAFTSPLRLGLLERQACLPLSIGTDADLLSALSLKSLSVSKLPLSRLSHRFSHDIVRDSDNI